MNKRLGIILGIGLVLVVLAAGLGIWLNRNITITSPSSSVQSGGDLIALPEPLMQFFAGGSKNRPTLVFRWSNLPAETFQIKIFRTKPETGKQEFWKTVTVNGQTSGAVEIVLRQGEHAADYTYHVETVNQGGTTTWSSPSSTQVSSDPPPPDIVISTSTTVSNPPAPSPSPTSTPPTTEPTSTAPTATTTPSSTATSTTPSSTPTSTPSSTPPTSSGIPYYTPQGTISGYGSPEDGSFWVKHVNAYIEIGWQNLSTSTTRLVISRAPGSNGPWTQLLAQNNPDAIGPTAIRLVDNTIGTAQYYLLDTFVGGASIYTYGPILLAPN